MRDFVRLHFGLAMALLTGAIASAAFVFVGWNATSALIVWNLAALTYLGLAWYRMATATLDHLRARAAELDFSDSVILALCVLIAVASLAGIGVELFGAKEEAMHTRLAGAGLALATVLISWTFLHTLFTLHYAHYYYSENTGGLRFPEEEAEPVYWDFLYFSFTIGVAAQTADVSVTSMPMRRLVFFHAVLSFLFNTTILALAINAGASLI